RIEIDRRVESQERAHRRLAAGHPAMRNGDAIAETGGAKFFSREEALEDRLGVEVGKILGDHLGDLFQDAFLAAALNVHQRTFRAQDVFESDHGEGSANQCALGMIKLFFLVLDQLAVEFVHEQVDCRIHVLVLGIGNHLAACDVQRGFGFLLEFLDLKNYLDGDDAIEMAFQSFALFFEVGTKSVGYFQMKTGDVDLHTAFSLLPCAEQQPSRLLERSTSPPKPCDLMTAARSPDITTIFYARSTVRYPEIHGIWPLCGVQPEYLVPPVDQRSCCRSMAFWGFPRPPAS